MNMPVQGTRPVTGPLFPVAPATGTTGTSPALPPPAPPSAPVTIPPPVANVTQTYAEGFDPSSVTVPELTPEQQTTVQQFEQLFQGQTLTAPQRSSLEPLARNLGFKSIEMMQHHLRNLSPAQRQTISSELRRQLAGTSKPDVQVIQETFQQAFKGAIENLFKQTDTDLPLPSFNSEPADTNRWDTASLASVYNGLATVQQQNPGGFRQIALSGKPDAQGNQTGLNFIRRSAPEIGNRDQYLQTMQQSIQIAHTTVEQGRVYLYDAAVQGSHRPITDLVVDKLSLISRQDIGSTELRPSYEVGEINARGLQRQPGESNGAYGTHANRLREQLTGDLLARYGNNDWDRLQEAVNFLTRYKGLGIPPVKRNGKPNDPATLAALQRMGPTNLQMVICRMEQVDAVGQMQRYLRDNLPGSQPLKDDGVLGPKTLSMSTAFQTSIALNNLKERVEDDPQLPEARKRELVDQFNALFQQLSANPMQARDVLNQGLNRVRSLINERPAPISQHTSSALVQDLTKMAEVVNGRFNPSSAAYLVGNWLNVMDSGRGHDLAEQLVVHELGHIWQHELDKGQSLQVEQEWAKLFDGTHQHNPNCGHDMQTAATQMTMQDFNDRLGSDRAAVTDYAAVDPVEDFAEASRLYTYDRANDSNQLMRRSLMKFLVINALNSQPMPSQEILRRAEACGYTPEQVRERLDTILGQGSEGIRFGLGLSNHLQQTYHELGHTLHAASEPVSVNFNVAHELGQLTQGTAAMHSAPIDTTPAPGARLSEMPLVTPEAPQLDSSGPSLTLPLQTLSSPPAPPPDPSESGWVFNQLTERYRELDTELKQPGLSPERESQLHGEKQALINDFVRFGPANARGLGEVDEGSVSFNQALSGRNYGNDKGTSNEGYAVVAAMAIYRATGSFNRDEHPALAEFLPKSFDSLLQDDHFSSAMKPGAPFAPTLLLEGGLDRLRWFEGVQAEVDKKISGANIRLLRLGTALNAIATANSTAIQATSPIAGAIAGAAGSVAIEAQLHDAFSRQRIHLDVARTELNQAITLINRSSGSQYPPLSEQDLKQFLISINSLSAAAITPEKLVTFLQQRALDTTFSANPMSPAN